MDTTATGWLEAAKAKASTAWIREFIASNLPPLIEGSISPQEFSDRLEARFLSRVTDERPNGLNTPESQKNYRSNIVQAIKTIDKNHPAIELVKLSQGEYSRLNDSQALKVADRDATFISPEQCEALVSHSRKLIKSAEWATVAAGLAVLTGRRISEILVGDFKPCDNWSLIFSGLAKKRDKTTSQIELEIPVLAPASEVLSAIDKLQRYLGKTDVFTECHGDAQQARKIANSRWAKSVCKECKKQFPDYAPKRSDRKELFTHQFRALYTVIAVHWFCPPTVLEHRYKAEIQGHFRLSADGKRVPSYKARASYDDFCVRLPSGHPAPYGVKLSDSIKPISVFCK